MTNKDKIHVLSRAVIVDQDHILLCKTQDLKRNFFFLPGGHVEHMESIENALIREIKEETGSIAKIECFLGCFEHSFVPGHNSICHNHEYNFIFKVKSEFLKKDTFIPQLESHIILTWQPLINLSTIDFRPNSLKMIIPKWLNSTHLNTYESLMI